MTIVKSIYSPLFIAGFLSFPAATGSANSNIVTNNDFEGTTYAGSTAGENIPTGWILGPPSPSTLSNVTVTNATGSGLAPENGSNYLRYQSTAVSGTNGADCVYQYLTTVPGQKYTFSFYAADVGDSNSNNVFFDAVWDETGADLSPLSVSADTNGAAGIFGTTGYVFESFTETASMSTTRIDFHADDTNGSILVDNVSVTAVPEPATISLLSGLLFLGLRRRSPKR